MVSIYMYSPHTPRWYKIMIICCHYSCSPTSVGSICLNKTSIILDDKGKRYVKVRYTDRLQKSTKDSNKVKSNKFNTCRWTPKSWGFGVSRLPIEGCQHPPQGTLSGILAIFGVATLCFWKLQLAAEAKVQKANVPGRKVWLKRSRSKELMKLCELYRNILWYEISIKDSQAVNFEGFATMHLKLKPQHALFTSRKCTKQKGGWYTGALMFNYFAFTGDSYSFKPSRRSSNLSNLFASIYYVMMVGNATKLIIPLQSFPSLYVTFCKDRRCLIWPTPITHPGILNGHIVADSCYCTCFLPNFTYQPVYIHPSWFGRLPQHRWWHPRWRCPTTTTRLVPPAPFTNALRPGIQALLRGGGRWWGVDVPAVFGRVVLRFFDTFQNSYHVWFFNFHFVSSLRVSLMSSQ